MSQPFLGELRQVGFGFAMRGWALCNGQLLAIQQNAALFSLLGTQYGGNGTTTFGLPDLRGRVPLCFGQGPGLSNYPIGQSIGTETVTLLSTQIPQHTHILAGDTTIAATSNASTPAAGNSLGAGIGAPSFAVNIYGTAGGATAPQAPANIGNFGGSQGHQNMQPYLVLNWLIALQGIFPSRN